MRFIAALDTSFFGYPAAQGADIDVTAWSRRQILQHLDLGMIAPSQISAGAINDAIEFVGDGVLVTEDVNGKVIVTISMAPQLMDWLLDVDTTTIPPEGGAALVWDADQELWVPGAPGSGSGGGTTLDSLTDVDTNTNPPSTGSVLLYDALIGQWIPSDATPASIDDLGDVDTTSVVPIEGQALVWDNTSASWMPGSVAGVPGDPGPICWSTPVPWSSATTYITGPPASVVTYLGSAYVAILTGANQQPDTSPTYWRLLVAKGAKGDTGDVGPASTIPGPANSLAIGTTTTGAAGSSATATITGSPPAQTLNLTIPKGDTGNPGSTGAPGPTLQNAMSWVGPLQVDAGDTVRMYNDSGVNVHITQVRLSLATAADAVVTVDVKLNGTTMFTVAPKPKITIGQLTETAIPDGAPVLWTAGSYITCRLTSVGSSAAPGRTLCMQLGVTA